MLEMCKNYQLPLVKKIKLNTQQKSVFFYLHFFKIKRLEIFSHNNNNINLEKISWEISAVI